MSLQDGPLRTLEDIERLERVPLARRLAVGSTYALLQQAVASSPQQPARCFAQPGHQPRPGEALTAQAFLGKVHQTANLLADLGIGPQDVIALLLPDLLEAHLLLWGGQAAGIVCPVLPCWPAQQMVDLLQAVRAKVLVVPGPEVSQELWQQTQRVRRQVESITTILQVQGPGKERDGVYAFNALLADYPSDCLHTGHEIAPDDIAIYSPLRDTAGMSGMVPLTHGNLLYLAWALGNVLTLTPEEVLLRGLARFFLGWWWPSRGVVQMEIPLQVDHLKGR